MADRAPHSAALRARLEVTGLAVGAGVAPDGVGWQGAPNASTFVGYLVLHSLTGGTVDGSIVADEDIDWRWQVTAVGGTYDQCELVGDKARAVLLGTPLTVSGRQVLWLRIDTPDGPRRDDAVQDPVWISTEVYRLATTP